MDVPVIASHIGNVSLAEKVIREGKAELVAIGRGLLADPELPRKAREGRFAEISSCCRCLQGCFERVLKAEPVTCLSNPAAGKERGFAIEPALKKKKIVVIGGGPAGMEAARICALRGHEVVYKAAAVARKI